MKQIIINVSDNATNFDVFEAIFGFCVLFDVKGKKELMECKFEDDEGNSIMENRLSKTWGNSQFELSNWVKKNESATLVNCKENDNGKES